MTYQLERRAAAMRLENSAYLYRRAASSPINKRKNLAQFALRLNADRTLLGADLPRNLPRHAKPMEIQVELFDSKTGAIAC